MNSNYPIRNASRAGFSLIELLIAVGIIGILAAIVIPMIINTTATSDEFKARRNAQGIASLTSQARSIGSNVEASGDVNQIVRDLITGVKGRGVMHNLEVKLSPLSEQEVSKASRYLEFNGGMLTYKAQ